jgi:hypothetical protein
MEQKHRYLYLHFAEEKAAERSNLPGHKLVSAEQIFKVTPSPSVLIIPQYSCRALSAPNSNSEEC